MADYNAMTKSKANFNLKAYATDGAATDTDVTVTGINTDCTVLFVFHNTPGTGIASIDLDEVSVTDDDTIQLSSTDTSSDELIVFWTDNTISD